jgi:hypothetical protein
MQGLKRERTFKLWVDCVQLVPPRRAGSDAVLVYPHHGETQRRGPRIPSGVAEVAHRFAAAQVATESKLCSQVFTL